MSWKDNQIIYQIYPKSFKDSNNDGIGDLKGVMEKLPYLQKLGITTLWLNPIFVSPQVDNGYDVSNYFAIDPAFGTMADFDNLVKAIHEKNMYLILDFVMNHTSDQHPWFVDARKSKKSLFRDYYLWQDPVAGSVPNNWGSFFGGSVWEKDTPTNQYYFHLFDKHMPDLNWRNPEVRHAMLQVALFWVKRGIDGLRLDAFIHTAKARFDNNFPNSSPRAVLAESFYANLPQVHQYLSEFVHGLHQVNPNLFILGEAASADADLLAAYTDRNQAECDSAVSFRTLAERPVEADAKLPSVFQRKKINVLAMKQIFSEIEVKVSGLPALYWNNHDMARTTNRYVGSIPGEILATLMYLQRGLPIIYYGEEIGMQDEVFVKPKDFEEPQISAWLRTGATHQMSTLEMLKRLSQTQKMAARGPMRWDGTKYYGFSTHTPWKLGKTDTETLNVASQINQTDSIWNYYQQLLRLKKTNLFTYGTQVFLVVPDSVYAYIRKTHHEKAIVACNLGQTVQKVNLDQTVSKILLQTGHCQITSNELILGPLSSIVLQIQN